jgi:hypothetical protein
MHKYLSMISPSPCFNSYSDGTCLKSFAFKLEALKKSESSIILKPELKKLEGLTYGQY